MAARFVFTAMLVLSLTGCERQKAEIAALKAENDRLRAEIVKLRESASGAPSNATTGGKPDFVLDMNELYKQRFEDNELRAKSRLGDKLLRVTGSLDSVTADSVVVHGTGKSRNMRMKVALEPGYASKTQDGLAALEKGVQITVQGRFVFDRMELTDGTLVNKDTGNVMTAQDLQSFSPVGPEGAPAPPPLPENQ